MSSSSSSGINASAIIRDHNGVDITSSIKIMVNHRSQAQLLTNSTENGFDKRQGRWGRLINSCPKGQTFIESHCTPVGGSLQRYVYTCRGNIPQPSATTGVQGGVHGILRLRAGYCEDLEICQDVRTENPAIVTASCVQTELFDEWTTTKDGKLRPMIDGAIFDPVISMYGVMSKVNTHKSIELDTFQVDTWAGQGDAAGGQTQIKKCRDCNEIQTDVLAPGTDSLKVEATLLTAGAMAGVLWLTLLSG